MKSKRQRRARRLRMLRRYGFLTMTISLITMTILYSCKKEQIKSDVNRNNTVTHDCQANLIEVGGPYFVQSDLKTDESGTLSYECWNTETEFIIRFKSTQTITGYTLKGERNSITNKTCHFPANKWVTHQFILPMDWKASDKMNYYLSVSDHEKTISFNPISYGLFGLKALEKEM